MSNKFPETDDGDLWEYNAPQFVDFTADDDDGQTADAWFDIDHENESAHSEMVDMQGTVCEGMEIVDADEVEKQSTPGGKTESRRLTRSMCATPKNEKNLPEAADSESTPSSPAKYHSAPTSPDKAKDKTTPQLVNNEEKKKVGNICTSLSEWRKNTKNLKTQQKSNSDAVKKEGVATKDKKSLHVSEDKSKDAKSAGMRKQKRSLDLDNDKKQNRTTRRSQGNNLPTVQNKAVLRRSASAKTDLATANNSLPLRRTESTERLARPMKSNIKRSNSSVRLNASVDRDQSRSIHRRTRSSSQSAPNDSLHKSTRPRSGSTSSHNDSVAPASKMPKLTIPSTPTVLKRKPTIKPTTEKTKNSEEKELEEIAFLRQQLSKKRKMAEQSYKKAMTSGGYAPVQAKIEPTKPMEFQFHTDSRIKSHPADTTQEEPKKDFTRILRSTSRATSPGPAHKGLTKPQPFSLTETRKRKLSSDSEPTEKYHSMAEKLQAFHKQTPERFRQKPRNEGRQTRNRSRSPGCLTVPKTPNLETRGRSRPVYVPSRQELEDQEVEEIKRHQFRANPVNQRIMSNPNTGVRKVPTKAPTEPEEFNLEIERRIHERESKKTNEEKKFEFHAQPVPKKILEGTVGVKPAKEIPLTHPQSPAFALKHRVRLPIEQPEEKEETKPITRKVAHHGVPFQPVLHHKTTVVSPFGFEDRDKSRMAHKDAKIEEYLKQEQKVERQMRKAHPVPHMGVPFQPKLSHECTRPEPFGFEERDKLVAARKEEKIRELMEEEKKAREFHAIPLPDHSVESLPPKKVKPATRPEPFKLEIDVRGAKKADEWSHKMEEEIRQKRSQVQFKARPAVVTQKEPFVAQKSTKALTDISEFTLNTERRSQQRDNFEMMKKAREAEIEGMRRQDEHKLEEEEKMAIAKLRMEMVHKPNPIKKFKPVEILSSDKPLTVAESPQFNIDRRLRSKVRI